MASEKKPELPIFSFGSQAEWRKWLEKNQDEPHGIWLQFFKKGSGISTVVYAEALDEALCFGWIDGQLKRLDEKSYLQRFTPRRARSTWSKRNIDHVARLESEGKMAEAGRREVEKAKADGRWENSYDSQSNMTIPDDLMRELTKDPKIKAFWESLNKVNQYAIVWRIQTASSQGIRENRMRAILEMLTKEEKIHP
ncbi:MAG: YdeI/OmpD-associated family protein [Prolixibacteraceae bacterium]